MFKMKKKKKNETPYQFAQMKRTKRKKMLNKIGYEKQIEKHKTKLTQSDYG